jgi:hypothetical protein
VLKYFSGRSMNTECIVLSCKINVTVVSQQEVLNQYFPTNCLCISLQKISADVSKQMVANGNCCLAAK